MGISGLLPLLAPVQKRRHMTEFKGKRIAIDGFVWLHRAAFRYCVELAKDPSTELLLPFLMSRISALINCGVVPVVVFDGQSLPSKLMTNAKRRKNRADALAIARSLEENGKIGEAFSYYQKAISITSATVWVWIKALQKAGIEYIVSPYEADAQLAFLARTGYVDAVITEDSDLIAYKVPLTLFRLDDSLHVMAISYNDALQTTGLTSDNFTALCIFAGCDYSEHIGKLGIKTALKLLNQFQGPEGVIATAQSNPKYTIPEGFAEMYKKASITFQCARAYDPKTQKLTNLSVPPEPADYLGSELAPDLLAQLVKGRIDTITLQPLELPESGPKSIYFSGKSNSQDVGCKSKVSWAKTLKPRPEIKKSQSKHFISYTAGEDPRHPQPRITSFFALDPSSKLKVVN